MFINYILTSLLFIIGVILLLLLLVKVLAIVKSIFWIFKNKGRFQDICREIQIRNVLEVFNEKKPNFFPFGLNDYKLRKYNLDKKYKTTIFFQKYLFRYNKLCAVILIYLIISSSIIILIPSIYPNIKFLFSILSFILLILVSSANFLISIQTAFSFVISGGFYKYFYYFDSSDSNNNLRETNHIELIEFLRKVLIIVATGTISCYISHLYFDGFKFDGKILPATNLIEIFRILFNSFYFTLTTITTTGFGDIIPNNFYGKISVVMIMIQGFFLLIVVLTSLFTFGKEQSERHNKE